MKRIPALLLALMLAVGTATAENAHINAFLVKVFSLIGATDPNSHTLYAELSGTGSVQIMKQDGVTRLELDLQGRKVLAELSEEAICFKAGDGQGYWISPDNITSVLDGAVSLLSVEAGVSLEKLSNRDRTALRASLRDLLAMLLEKGLQERTEDGRYTLTLRLTNREAVDTVCAWADGMVRDPAAFGAWQKLAAIADAAIGTALRHRYAVGDALGDFAFVLDILPAVREIAGGFAAIGDPDRDWPPMRDKAKAALIPETADRALVHAALSLTEAGDFDSLNIYDPDGGSRFYLRYEGSELVIGPLPFGLRARVSAETDDVLTVSANAFGLYSLQGSLRLTEGETWLLALALDNGSAPFSMGTKPTVPFVPLLEQGGMTEITVTSIQTILGLSP